MNWDWIALLAIILWVFTFVIWILRRKANYDRTMNLAFLKVTMPKKDSDLDEKKEIAKDFKEMIWPMEQLFASLKSIHSRKLKHLILGQDTISFEYIVHKWEIMFYVVVPQEYKALVEKQINGFYTDAIVEETKEENIFKGKKHYTGTYLYLKKPFFYPVKTYQKLESDPINNITNAFSKLDENESAAVQILLKPIWDDWQGESAKISTNIMQWRSFQFTFNPFKLLWLLVTLPFKEWKTEDSMWKSNDNTSALTQERAKTVDEKGDKTGYETVIRIITTGKTPATAHSELLNIVSAFTQFNYPDFNWFSYTLRHSDTALVKNYLFRYFRKPISLCFSKSILNTEELSSIYHFPHSKYNKTPEIKWQNFKIVKAPIDIPTEGLTLWDNVYRGVKKEIKVANEDRFRHFYVIGQTGTGKSSIMQVMARQDLKNWNWLAVLDPHGDLAKDLLPFVPRERADDVIIFDPGDTKRPLWMNLLEAETDDEKEMVAMDAMNIMIKLFGNEIFGPRLQDYFRNAALTLMDFPSGWAITDVVRLFTDNAFQEERRRHVKNPIVKSWWDNTYAKMWDREKKEIIPFYQAKFSPFITNSLMRNIIGQTKSSFDMFEAMQEGKIILINLSKWILWDINSELLWLIMVSKVQMSAMKRQKIPKEERKDFFMYIDEFQNYITPAIESILSEARKYRLGMVLANQYLWQLEKSDALTKSSVNLKNAIFGNVWSVMSYKIWPDDGEFLAKYYAPTFSEQDLVNMDKYKAVMKLSIDNQPSIPFSIIPKNPYLETWDTKLAKAFTELSRLKYWRDVAFVDKEIKLRLWSK